MIREPLPRFLAMSPLPGCFGNPSSRPLLNLDYKVNTTTRTIKEKQKTRELMAGLDGKPSRAPPGGSEARCVERRARHNRADFLPGALVWTRRASLRESIIKHVSAGADPTAITARYYSRRRGPGRRGFSIKQGERVGGKGGEIKALFKRMLNTSPLGLDFHVLYA